ncbi:MAG: hypothetical protein WC135_00560 [Bacteroidales bacterium]
MKIKILVFIFLIQASFVFGQNINPRKYYDNINRAELSIIDSNYSKACNYYKKAFKYLDEPFGKDLNNFLVCGFYTDDSVALRMCSPFFVKRKYDYDTYSMTYKDKNLADYWLSLIENSDINAEVDTNFVGFINDLMSKDVNSRKVDIIDGEVIPRDKTGYGIFDQDSLNMANLINYMRNHKVELNEKTVSSNESNYNRYFSTMDITGQLLLIHYAQSARHRKNPLSLNLKEKVLMGEFDNQLYAHLVDYRGYGLDGLDAAFYHDKYGVRTSLLLDKERVLTLSYPQYTKKELKQINKNRREIYLCDYDDFIKKLNYEKIRWDIIYSKKDMFRAEFVFSNPWSLGVDTSGSR